jgi:hypothetical protein
VTTVARPKPDQMRIDEAGFYLTNGVFLYRLLGFVEGGSDDVVELEDCYGLDVVRVPLDDLCERRLRVVTPAPA